MLRLTLRSSNSGRFLARVVDPGGYPFVLDFGDERIIADVNQRLLHGFTMWRHGKLINAATQHPQLLILLAEYYASEGMLVFFEEPTWPGRLHSLEDRLPGPESIEDAANSDVVAHFPTLDPLSPIALNLPDLDADDDLHTELIGPDDLPIFEPSLHALSHSLQPLGLDDTERMNLPDLPTDDESLSEEAETGMVDLSRFRKKK